MGTKPDRQDTWLDRDGALDAIRRMGEEDLLFLNAQIADRLKLIAQARSTVELARFGVGDRVGFPGKDGLPREGVITRLHKKTVSIITDEGHRWNVSPGLLKALSR